MNIKEALSNHDSNLCSKFQLAQEEGFEAFQNGTQLSVKHTDTWNNVREVIIEGSLDKVQIAINNQVTKFDQIIISNLQGQCHNKFLSSLKKVMYFRLCEGFKNPGDKEFEELVVMNRKANTISASCSVLVEPQNHSVICKHCLNLKKTKIKQLRKHQKENTEISLKSVGANHKYLSRGSLIKRLKTVQAEKQTLAKKLKRIKEKLEKESVALSEADNEDMVEVFQYSEGNVTFENENMRLLWECQREALKSKDSRQRRWHPK